MPAATCDTVLSTAGYERIASDGLEPRDTHAFDPLAAEMVDAGGLRCTWIKPRTDYVLTVVQVGVAPADEAGWIEALGEYGYSRTDTPVPGAHVGPPEVGSGATPIAVLDHGTLTFVSLPRWADNLNAPS